MAMASMPAIKGRRAACVLRLIFMIGGMMSPIWFGIQLWLTHIHELDAVIINYSGKLRYHMQNIGVSYCMRNLEKSDVGILYNVYSDADTLATMESVIASFMGSRKDEDVPEALDEVVKDSLRELNDTLGNIKALGPRISSMSLPELRTIILEINAATRSIDDIVHAASEGANRRVNGLFMLNMIRALVQFLWACITLSIVGHIWAYYYTAHITLDLAQKRQMTMLNGLFDVVVLIGIGQEYQLLESDSKLDHLVGRSMQGQSILSCASDLSARVELQKLLQTAGSSVDSVEDANKALGCVSSWVRRSWWWNLVPSVSDEKLPVSPMIRTTWCQDSADGLRRSIHLEVIATPYDDNSGTVLLGLRVIATPALDFIHSLGSVSTQLSESDGVGTPPQASALAFPVAEDDRLPIIPEASERAGSLDGSPGSLYTGWGSVRDARSATSGADTVAEDAFSASPNSGSETTPPPTLYGNAMQNAGTNRLAAVAASQSNTAFASQLSERLQALHQELN
eukprot:TRINITY_DN30268_c0_g2_i1.p1 TRINITY_DN30268_c0_g2~~TRINITY_DN30268_c0_g2_i1.p1  ORF type:complete len:523 (-),score=58.07 TRINITY_DN30268_c0_g2_i1:291-1826(-)